MRRGKEVISMKKRVIFVAAVVGMLALAVGSASASSTFAATIYRSATYTCSGGASDTSAAKNGTFSVTESHHVQVVDASVTVDNLYPGRAYNVSVTESGYSCLTNLNVASFVTDSHGKAVVHFQFWAHTGETSAWVTIRHGFTSDIVRSTTVPING
jgi:hypothetical protein